MMITFDTSQKLPKQFVISRDIPEDYSEWHHHQLNGWTFACAKEVPVISLYNETEEIVGFLLGWVILDGVLLPTGSMQTIGPDQEDAFRAGLCGRYLYFSVKEGATYAETDAGGLLPLVYSKQGNCAASTPTALLPLIELTPNEPVRAAFGIPERHGWFPFGLTPFSGLVRLLPNHRLCLETWEATRYWPTEQTVDLNTASQRDPREIAGEIAKIVQRNVGAIIEAGRGIAHLTAGYDSRMVVAATKPFIDKVQFETVRSGAGETSLDCHMAEQIARKLGLNHEFLDAVSSSSEDVDAWLNRTGTCVYDYVTDLAATAEHYDRHYHALTGTCGEVARAYYWSGGLSGGVEGITADDVVTRLGVPKIEETLNAAEIWLKGLPATRESVLWDLAYIEQRLACWAGPSIFGHNVSYPSLSPFNSHQIYRLMLSLPDDYRVSQNFVHDYIEMLWPELLKFPFNRANGLARLKFAKSELKAILPNDLKVMLKSILRR